jgi:DNA polymerase lambda
MFLAPNKDIADQLKLLQNQYDMANQLNNWKHMAKGKVIAGLLKWPKRLVTHRDVAEFAQQCKGCGKSTVEKIIEIIETGELERVKARDTPEERAKQLFERIWGVGPKSARKLVDAGCRTLDDVDALTKTGKLPKGMSKDLVEISVKFFADIEARIPRSECTAISAGGTTLVTPRCLFEPCIFFPTFGCASAPQYPPVARLSSHPVACLNLAFSFQ